MSKTSHERHEHKVAHQAAPHPVAEHADYQAHGWGDALIVLLIIGLGLFFILPVYSLVPKTAQLAVMILFAITVILFAGSLWRGKPSRMAKPHPTTAAHLAYLAAVVVLATVIILQLLQGALDFWLVIILVVVLVVHSLVRLAHGR